jgi:hypothetical protein
MSYVQTYPMAPAGGLFLLTVGVGIVLGAVLPRARFVLLGVSGAIAVLTLLAFARSLTAPFGVPRPVQLWSLVFAVALELLLVPLAIRHYRLRGERAVTLGVLLAVGAHFLPMAVAFGPVVVALGLSSLLNAMLGLTFPSRLSLRFHWLADGDLKIAAGAVLYLVTPALGS